MLADAFLKLKQIKVTVSEGMRQSETYTDSQRSRKNILACKEKELWKKLIEFCC